MICRHITTHEWVCGWLGGSVGQWVGSGQMTNNLINLDLIKIIQFCLKIYDLSRHPTHGWVVGCVSGSMGGSGEITNYLINLDIIEIIQFFLKIYDLWRHLHLWVGVWVVGWMGGSVGQWVGSGHITKYRINFDLIKIIKFCLKIYDLLRHPHLWVGVWVNECCQVKWLI